MSFAAIGASIAEFVHKFTGKTPLKSIFDKISKNKREKIISYMLEEAGDLSSKEKKVIREAMNFGSVFRIVTGIDNPSDFIDKDLEAKAELRLKEIEKKDEETYSTIMMLKAARLFGVNRINRLNKFLIENTIDDIIQVHNLLREKYPDHSNYGNEYYDKLIKAFNFEPREDDEIERIAYEVQKLLTRESMSIRGAHFDIYMELEKNFGKKISNTYSEFLRKSFPEPKKLLKFMKMMNEKYTASSQDTLNSIKEAMEIKSDSVRMKYFDINLF